MQKERADPGSGMKKQKKKWKSRALVFIAAAAVWGPQYAHQPLHRRHSPLTVAAKGGGGAEKCDRFGE